MKSLFLAIFFSAFCSVIAQNDSAKVALSVYVETYYGYDFTQPKNHIRHNFVYSHNKHNEVNLNLGFLKAAYSHKKIRANLALMTGTYANANLAAESGVLKNIYEANLGLKLSSNNNLWLDAGVFASHIGFESAMGKDCWALTRSMAADNSPYFETGAKISYLSPSERWFLSALLLNGWQRIERIEGNQTPAFGHQITYKPNDKVLFNSSSFIGNDKPDSVKQMRYFHNFYTQISLNSQWSFTGGLDVGAEQKAKGSKAYNFWFTPILMAKYNLNEKMNLTARGEYYADKKGVIISSSNGFQTFAYSFNFDYKIVENAIWRVEAKQYSAKDAIFLKENQASRNNTVLSTALAISF